VLIQPGPIIEKAGVRNGEIVIRSMLSLNITWDHRIVDGVPVGRLVNKIAEIMECPELLL
jgi:pyruvate dehydrogenase E2 component (dihydrolipoamide acetyltransferase)